jgi:hypothetical protein
VGIERLLLADIAEGALEGFPRRSVGCPAIVPGRTSFDGRTKQPAPVEEPVGPFNGRAPPGRTQIIRVLALAGRQKGTECGESERKIESGGSQRGDERWS